MVSLFEKDSTVASDSTSRFQSKIQMQKFRNDFTDQMIILVAIIIPSIIGSWIGGGGGFFIGLIVAVPITLGVIRYVEGTFPGMKSKTSR